MANIQLAYQIVTDRITQLLEEGVAVWQKPWNAEAGMPRNLFTRVPYRGINVWMLGAQGYESPFWGTMHQVNQAGGHVRAGESATYCVFYKRYEKENKETGNMDKRFVLNFFKVYNAAQLQDVAVPHLEKEAYPFDPIALCHEVIDAMPQRPTIKHGSTQAFYRPREDSVYMPMSTQFQQPSGYYATIFHELTHSTGHESRLKRDLSQMVRYGDRAYAEEELVAEMGAAYLCGVCGIANETVDNSAAYLKGWLKVLRDDVKMLVRAAGQAQKAADFIQGVHLDGQGA